ncbi:MAG: 50S ribosomal protein L31 [Elusimicrobiota bacterium]
MKTGIHPSYLNAQVVCACGSEFATRSTKKVIKLEICSACHPFYTGKQRLLDTAGRVERFKKRFAATEGKTVARAPSSEVRMKKLDTQALVKDRKKVLSTAPKAGEEAKKKDGKKDSKEKKTAKA